MYWWMVGGQGPRLSAESREVLAMLHPVPRWLGQSTKGGGSTGSLCGLVVAVLLWSRLRACSPCWGVYGAAAADGTLPGGIAG